MLEEVEEILIPEPRNPIHLETKAFGGIVSMPGQVFHSTQALTEETELGERIKLTLNAN